MYILFIFFVDSKEVTQNTEHPTKTNFERKCKTSFFDSNIDIKEDNHWIIEFKGIEDYKRPKKMKTKQGESNHTQKAYVPHFQHCCCKLDIEDKKNIFFWKDFPLLSKHSIKFSTRNVLILAEQRCTLRAS